jgi:predicted anti-sigma-YlaC factor YlaD
MDVMVGSCEETREQLSASVEGELTGVQRMRVRLHLAGCDLCSAVARSLRKTMERLRDLDETFAPAPSPSIVPAVLERIRRHERE